MDKSAVCPLMACKKSGICVRYANYLKAKAEQESYSIINTERIHPDDNGCEYCLVARQVKVAYGFEKLYSSLPVANAKYFWRSSCFRSETTYYRYKRGECKIDVEKQEKLLELFRRKGADISVGFDRYQMETDFVKPLS